MAFINELDKNTIDQIAAGEVVERPASVVKELVENAIDSGATAVTVEIKGGGIDMIRVTDNGSGIEKSQIRKAFKRHATSKLKNIDDLFSIHSLGFRGEALSSISSVAQVDCITKTKDDLTGTRYSINGGEEAGMDEIGAPDGTTFIIRNLFYNTPARKKFLKTPQTEGSYIGDVMEHLALDNPTISFHYINNKDDKFSTSGNGDLKELIYRIYGRDVSVSVRPISASDHGITVEGYLGEPTLNRSNRNFEIFFVNGRYVKDKIISKALEEGYKQFLMMHKFPFAILHIRMDPSMVDVNVHPAKLEVRFNNQALLYDFIKSSVENVLSAQEMIPDALLSSKDDEKASETASVDLLSVSAGSSYSAPEKVKAPEAEKPSNRPAPQPFERVRFEENKVAESDESKVPSAGEEEKEMVKDNTGTDVIIDSKMNKPDSDVAEDGLDESTGSMNANENNDASKEPVKKQTIQETPQGGTSKNLRSFPFMMGKYTVKGEIAQRPKPVRVETPEQYKYYTGKGFVILRDKSLFDNN